MPAFNPFRTQFTDQHGAPVVDNFRLGDRSERAVATSGEINASSKLDLMHNMREMQAAAASGQIQSKRQVSPQERKERLATFTAAWHDPSGAGWSALGASIADAIKQQGDRQGFLRRLVNPQPLEQGQMPRVPMPSHDAVAVVATSSAAVEYQVIRNRVYTPPEFPITANLRVENIELQQVSGDIIPLMYNKKIK
jgi:hypothetical protein